MPQRRIRTIAVGGGAVTNNGHLSAPLRSELLDVRGVVSDCHERVEMTGRTFTLPGFGNELDFTGWQKDAEAVIIGVYPTPISSSPAALSRQADMS